MEDSVLHRSAHILINISRAKLSVFFVRIPIGFLKARILYKKAFNHIFFNHMPFLRQLSIHLLWIVVFIEYFFNYSK